MNRFQLIQVVIIALALWIGYETFTYIFLFTEELVLSFDRNVGQGVIIYGINAFVYIAAFFIIIKKTTAIATWVLSKTDLDPDVQLNLSASTFLLGIIVFWGLKITVESGADILSYGIAKFSETVKYQSGPSFSRTVISSCIKLIAGIILLRYAKQLSQYFEQQTDEHDPHQILGDVASEEIK